MVNRETERNSEFIKGIEHRSREFHIDHKYSKKAGFENGILPHVIGGLNNLEMLSVSENCSKNSKCSVSLSDI